MSYDKTSQYLKLDERNHVEKPLLHQLDGLIWEIIEHDSKQQSGDSLRQRFTGNILTCGQNVIFYVT